MIVHDLPSFYNLRGIFITYQKLMTQMLYKIDNKNSTTNYLKTKKKITKKKIKILPVQTVRPNVQFVISHKSTLYVKIEVSLRDH